MLTSKSEKPPWEKVHHIFQVVIFKVIIKILVTQLENLI